MNTSSSTNDTHDTQHLSRKDNGKSKALEMLHQGVTDLMSSEGWQQALKMKSRFHSYSFFNVSLILAQKPDATLVAGYRKWPEFNRFVRKGEKGIGILAPLLKKNPAKADETILFGFKVVYIFDVSQTDGEDLPLLQSPKLLESDGEGIRSAISSLETFATTEGFSVAYDFNHPHALGAYRPLAKSILIRPDLPALQTLKTLVHELAHALLRDLSDERHSAELEAESTAFLVCHELGLDTSSYSFVYLAGWTESLEGLIASGERASKTSERILMAIRCKGSLEATPLEQEVKEVVPV